MMETVQLSLSDRFKEWLWSIPACARIMRRMQNVPQFFRENRDEKLASKEQDTDSRRQRMTFSNGIELDQNWMMANTRTRRMVQVEAVEVHRKKESIFNKDGIRFNVGTGIIIGLACVLVTVLLVDLGGIGYTNRQIARTETKIENYRRDSERTETQLADKKGDSQLINQAVQLNMVSSGSNVIVLHAPTDANMTFGTEQTARVDSENLAVIQGD